MLRVVAGKSLPLSPLKSIPKLNGIRTELTFSKLMSEDDTMIYFVGMEAMLGLPWAMSSWAGCLPQLLGCPICIWALPVPAYGDGWLIQFDGRCYFHTGLWFCVEKEKERGQGSQGLQCLELCCLVRQQFLQLLPWINKIFSLME